MSIICLHDGCLEPSIDPDDGRCMKHASPIYVSNVLRLDSGFGRVRILLDDCDEEIKNQYFGMIKKEFEFAIRKLDVAITQKLIEESKKYQNAEVVDIDAMLEDKNHD